jgi:choline dehydrogenase-like flavoprotein
MEHLEMPSGELVLAKPESTKTKMYIMDYGVTKARAELSLSAQAQKEHRILNGTASIEPGVIGEPIKSTFEFLPPQLIAATMAWEKGGKVGPPPLVAPSPSAESAAVKTPSSAPRNFHLITRQEQAPNPNSRVTLSSEKDAMGMPRVVFNWQLTELDKHSMRTYYKVLGQEMGRSGVGRVQLRDWLLSDDRTWPSFLSGGWHHMGTTRMHTDPKRGVVDANCRVHGIGNLYVAGAAVYPTAGSANPTLTLVALSLRLSDHLRTVLAKARSG